MFSLPSLFRQMIKQLFLPVSVNGELFNQNLWLILKLKDILLINKLKVEMLIIKIIEIKSIKTILQKITPYLLPHLIRLEIVSGIEPL